MCARFADSTGGGLRTEYSGGYHYDVARNGQGAIEKFTSAQYSIVMMDGFEITRRIRKWEAAQKSTPATIIAMTAHAMRGNREKCIQVWNE